MKLSKMSNRGFSLSQVLLAVAIGSVLSLGLAQLMSNVFKNQKGISTKLEAVTLANDLGRIFKDYTSSCSCALQSDLKVKNQQSSLMSQISSANAEIILDESNLNLNFYSDAASCAAATKKPVIASGRIFGNPNIHIDSIRFSRPMSMGGGKYLVDLIVSVQSVDNSQMKIKPITISNIPLMISAGNLSCSKNIEELANVGCPAGQVLAGFDANGTEVCRSLNSSIANISCNGNTVLAGFDADARPICRTIASAPPPPPPQSQPTTTVVTPPIPSSTPSLASEVGIAGMLCSGGAEASFVVQEYVRYGRCADSGGFNYWRQNYYNFINAGQTEAQAQASVTAQLRDGLSEASQISLDSLCPDGGSRYKFIRGTSSNPTRTCTVRCSASPTDPNCAR